MDATELEKLFLTLPEEERQKFYEMQTNGSDKHVLQSAVYRDKTGPVWDMSQERAFIETLLGQRFNFFVVFFSLVLGGALNARTQFHFELILTLGTLICWLMARTLFRSQYKLDLILDDLFLHDASHPASIINKRANSRKVILGRKSMRRVIGYWIPCICCLALFIATGAAWLNFLRFAPK